MGGMRAQARAAEAANPMALFAMALVVAAALIVGRPAAAGEAPAPAWRAGEVQGDVRVRVGHGPWKTLRRGEVVRTDSEIETGAAGRVRVTGPGGSVVALPDSRLGLRGKTAGGGTGARIIQWRGRLQFAGAPTDAPFRVETPLLTATIRGAAVTMTVNADNAALYVAEGAAQVTSLLTGEAALVRPEQLAWINVPSGGRLKTIAVRPRPRANPPPTVGEPPKPPVRTPHSGGRALARLTDGESEG